MYNGLQLYTGYRLGILVGKKVVMELKSVEALVPVHFKQPRNYLSLIDCKLGLHLPINFNVVSLRDNIHRIVHEL